MNDIDNMPGSDSSHSYYSRKRSQAVANKTIHHSNLDCPGYSVISNSFKFWQPCSEDVHCKLYHFQLLSYAHQKKKIIKQADTCRSLLRQCSEDFSAKFKVLANYNVGSIRDLIVWLY